LVLLSTALLHCSKESTPPPASPEPAATVAPPEPAPTAESMSPASGTTTATVEPTTPPAAEPTAPSAMPLSDPQIAEVLLLANSAEVEQGKVAQGKAKNARVKKFAAMMVADHGKGKEKLKKLDLKPAESPFSVELKGENESVLSTLKGTSAADFDTKYIDSQVEGHKKVLAAINEKLIPAAADPKLKDLLTEMQKTVDAHLTEAEAIQGELAAAR
jgi:putative membrane protein